MLHNSEMSFDKQKRKEFRESILRSELLSIGEKFHTTAMKWLGETKKMYLDNSAELRIHPNSIMTELKRINHERAYILYKMDSLAKDKTLPAPINLRKKLRKLEMEVQFQQNFPDEYNQFTEKLKEKLKTKPYSPKKRPIKPSRELPIEWDIRLDEPRSQNRPKNSKPRKVSSPCVNTLMQMIHGHGSKIFQDSDGYFRPPAFTKPKIEKTFGVWISHQKFQTLKTKMNNKQQKRKHGHAKKLAQIRKERHRKLYNFQNPL